MQSSPGNSIRFHDASATVVLQKYLTSNTSHTPTTVDSSRTFSEVPPALKGYGPTQLLYRAILKDPHLLLFGPPLHLISILEVEATDDRTLNIFFFGRHGPENCILN